MSTPWMITSWPPVQWQPSRDESPSFVHLGTRVASQVDPELPHMGQAMWGARVKDMAVGLSWDWIEVADDIVALTDPMMVVTNLRLLGSEGEVMTSHETAPYLNALVRHLPWQAEVKKALLELVPEQLSCDTKPCSVRSEPACDGPKVLRRNVA